MPTHEIVWPSYIHERNSLECMEVEKKKRKRKTNKHDIQTYML